MGFAATARLFEERANKARDPELRAHFEEAAGFYRKLAGIAPEFPPRFPGNKSWRGSRLEQRAEECRTMAEYFQDPTARRAMMALAETYEQLAKAAE